MYVKNIRIQNVKSFANSGDIVLSRGINILLGPNNAGKSVIIKSLYEIQKRGLLKTSDIRYGEGGGEVKIEFDDIGTGFLLPHSEDSYSENGIYNPILNINKSRTQANENNGEWHIWLNRRINKDNWDLFPRMPSEEPGNYIYPYLSKRKVMEYARSVDRNQAIQVPENLSNLVAKIDALADSQHSLHKKFTQLCKEVLGFQVSTFSADGGKQAGIRTGDFDGIPIEDMGEGVPNLLGFITNLCFGKNKLFLIEEIENDVHPKALKKLLQVIGDQTDNNNQFVISTHSNIVVKMLGSLPSTKIHKIEMSFNQQGLPTSTYSVVPPNPESRAKILEDLGYEMLDYDLWKGWLILEESSAERIIREYLIKWFAESLIGKLKTVSSGGVDSLDVKFEAFNNLFLFVHLEPTYKNKAWVIADGEPNALQIITALKAKYTSSGWEDDHFLNFTKHDFEEYYPPRFSSEVSRVLAISGKREKREAKRLLLNDVIDWIGTNEAAAKRLFESSAAEVIDILRTIETKLSM